MKRLLPFLIACGIALAGCSKSSTSEASAPAASTTPAAIPSTPSQKVVIGMLPKSKGNAYFLSCEAGARRAANELGVELLFDGPTDTNPAKQNEIVENWIARGVDAIAVAAENKEGISTALLDAQKKGIKVITYDADALPSARTFFVNQATAQGIGETLMDEAARLCGNQGEFAVITASTTAANQQEWLKYIQERLAAKYPNMKLDIVRPCDDQKDKAQTEATTMMSAFPNLKLIMAICSPGVPGAAEAVSQAGKAGKVMVIGLGLPNENKKYVLSGITSSVILWNTMDLGYLTIYAAYDLATGKLKPGDKSITAGTLGTFQIDGDNILLGKPYIFNQSNINNFDF